MVTIEIYFKNATTNVIVVEKTAQRAIKEVGVVVSDLFPSIVIKTGKKNDK